MKSPAHRCCRQAILHRLRNFVLDSIFLPGILGEPLSPIGRERASEATDIQVK